MTCSQISSFAVETLRATTLAVVPILRQLNCSKTIELTQTLNPNPKVLTLNPNQLTFNPMVNPSFGTFSALINSNFLSYMKLLDNTMSDGEF